jgi:hypothetical protein
VLSSRIFSKSKGASASLLQRESANSRLQFFAGGHQQQGGQLPEAADGPGRQAGAADRPVGAPLVSVNSGVGVVISAIIDRDAAHPPPIVSPQLAARDGGGQTRPPSLPPAEM